MLTVIKRQTCDNFQKHEKFSKNSWEELLKRTSGSQTTKKLENVGSTFFAGAKQKKFPTEHPGVLRQQFDVWKIQISVENAVKLFTAVRKAKKRIPKSKKKHFFWLKTF